MKKRLLATLWAYALIVALLVAIPAAAQLNTADILGTVTDAAGAVVPNAKVTVTNTATSVARTLQTSGSGEYIFNLLPSGQYSVTVEAPSFKKSTTNVTLVAGDRARIDVPLQIGETNQVVEVTAISPALQTDSSTLRDSVSAQSVQDLPLNGRNYITLVETAPGAAAGPANSILSGTRPDGRDYRSLRNIECAVDVLPRVHGSAVFQRGETQALVTITLGTTRDEQRVDGLFDEYSKKFMLDYYFPSYSVGEVRPIRGPGRRVPPHGQRDSHHDALLCAVHGSSWHVRCSGRTRLRPAGAGQTK